METHTYRIGFGKREPTGSTLTLSRIENNRVMEREYLIGTHAWHLLSLLIAETECTFRDIEKNDSLAQHPSLWFICDLLWDSGDMTDGDYRYSEVDLTSHPYAFRKKG